MLLSVFFCVGTQWNTKPRSVLSEEAGYSVSVSIFEPRALVF